MKPKQFFFAALGGLILVIGGASYGYYYGYQQISASSKNLAITMAEQSTSENQISSLTDLQHEYSHDVVPIMPLIDEALPRDKKQTEILAQIERAAAGAGLTVSLVTMPSPGGLPSEISQTIQAEGVLALPINFAVSGTYAQLQEMTQHLETLNRYTNISTLTVTKSITGPSYSYNLNAYIKP